MGTYFPESKVYFGSIGGDGISESLTRERERKPVYRSIHDVASGDDTCMDENPGMHLMTKQKGHSFHAKRDKTKNDVNLLRHMGKTEIFGSWKNVGTRLNGWKGSEGRMG